MDSLFDVIFSFGVGLAIVLVILIKTSIKFVPQNRAFVVERFGKYSKSMTAGLNFIVPFIDRVAYNQSSRNRPSMYPARPPSPRTISALP